MRTKTILTGVFFILFFVACNLDQDNKPTVPYLPSVNPTQTVNTPSVAAYRIIEPFRIEALNKEIQDKKLKTELEIMQAYTPQNMNATGNYTYDVQTNLINDREKEITLISENFEDDSLNGLKVVLSLVKENEEWKVKDIKESYKCQLNRGQQTWSSSLCN